MGAESDSLWLNSLNEKNNWKNKYTYESLKWIYDTLGYTTAANPFETDKRLPKDFYKENGDYLDFDQTEFFDVDFGSQEFTGREQGKIYIPNQCYDGEIICKVHFSFHRNNKAPNDMAETKRFNNIGALNDIIMVYPSVKSWDTMNITPEKDNKNSKLAQGILGMIARVTNTEVDDECTATLDAAEESLTSIEGFLAEDPAYATFVEFDIPQDDECIANENSIEQRQVDIIDSDEFKIYQFKRKFWS